MKALNDMTIEELWELFPIILRPHNSEYEIWYNVEKENLTHVLFACDIYRINHIGSTAVNGLIAKPIVDILLELPEAYNMDVVSRLLTDSGWILMQQDSDRKILDLNKGYTPNGFAKKVYHLHVKPAGDWGELYFRDYLQTHPEVARKYETMKLKLLRQFEHNRDAYTNAKTTFVMESTKKARVEFAGRYSPLTINQI